MFNQQLHEYLHTTIPLMASPQYNNNDRIHVTEVQRVLRRGHAIVLVGQGKRHSSRSLEKNLASARAEGAKETNVILVTPLYKRGLLIE